MVKDWEFVRSYILKDGYLFLALMADGGIYEFAPIGGSKAAAPNSRVASTAPIEYECTRAGAGNDTIILRQQRFLIHPARIFSSVGISIFP
jgi:hypothetical protein